MMGLFITMMESCWFLLDYCDVLAAVWTLSLTAADVNYSFKVCVFMVSFFTTM